MDELIAFVKARLDEDEAVAERALAGPWHVDSSPLGEPAPWRVMDEKGLVVTWTPGFYERGERDAAHIARHDPARALREVEAKRAIIARYSDMHWHAPALPESRFPELRTEETGACRICVTLRLLAAAWSDHPDYRAEWKPDS